MRRTRTNSVLSEDDSKGLIERSPAAKVKTPSAKRTKSAVKEDAAPPSKSAKKAVAASTPSATKAPKAKKTPTPKKAVTPRAHKSATAVDEKKPKDISAESTNALLETTIKEAAADDDTASSSAASSSNVAVPHKIPGGGGDSGARLTVKEREALEAEERKQAALAKAAEFEERAALRQQERKRKAAGAIRISAHSDPVGGTRVDASVVTVVAATISAVSNVSSSLLLAENSKGVPPTSRPCMVGDFAESLIEAAAKATSAAKEKAAAAGGDGASTPDAADSFSVVVKSGDHVSKGRNISKRGWKRTNQPKASTFMRNDKQAGRAIGWDERKRLKEEKQEIKALENELKEAKRSEKAAARKHREERQAMRQANEMRGTTMQTITKTHKLKTMNKKQLRNIKKTAVNAQTGQLELVSPWQKK